VGFKASIGNSASLRQVGWERGAVASAAAFQPKSSGENFMNTDTLNAASWNFLQSQCKFLEQQVASGNIE
jgi:hypothetical protein